MCKVSLEDTEIKFEILCGDFCAQFSRQAMTLINSCLLRCIIFIFLDREDKAIQR